MAYSDYGGLAYKNKELRTDHCDVILFSEGDPDPKKHYPYFFGENRDGKFPNAHVSLGDQDMRVMLYKQSWFEIWYKGEKLDPFELLTTGSKRAVKDFETDYKDDNDKPYFNSDAFLEKEKKAIFKFKKYKIELFWEHTDNYYIYGKLTQPDKSVWIGFSGYGIGNGLDDSYGYSTKEKEDRMFEIFNL